MTAINAEALGGWDSADEAERRAVLAHLTARAAKAYKDDLAGGMTSEFRDPVIEILRATVEDGHLIATATTSHRVYHYGQSGSDWSIQTVIILELSFATGSLVERVLHEDTVNLSEGRSDDHDDAYQARQIVDAWLARL